MPFQGKPQTLGDQVRVARAVKRLTLRKLASQIGRTPSYLSDIENNRRVPSEDVLTELSETLDLDFDELMAASGRLGEEAHRYLRRTPEAGLLFRRLSERNVSGAAIDQLIRQISDEEAGGSDAGDT